MAYRFSAASLLDEEQFTRGFAFRSAIAPAPEATRSAMPLPTSPMLFGKDYTAFHADGVGDGKPPLPVSPLLITSDAIPGDTTTTATLTVDGAHITSTIDTIGDQDFFKVDLVAGHTYNISMFQVIGGPNLVPLPDAYIELYDANGQLVTSADGGGPNTPEGLDAILTFTALTTGTYYIAAQAFDQVAQNGTTGDGVGDYEVFVTTVDHADPTAYVPFYPVDSPLNAIDWGTQFPRTSRNPDGDNGTRSDNGVANGGTPIDNNPYGIVGKNVITYYFAKTGDIFTDEDPTTPGTTETMVALGMQPWEKAAFLNAFALYSQVADVVYVEVQSRAEADIKIVTYRGTPGAGASLLGRMSPPGTDNAGQIEINVGDVRWTEDGVKPGGFYFPTLLHELGHGHGMAHPHDNGGHSSVMRGSDDGSVIGGATGDFDLSQQVFTVMSYNDGWATSPYGQPSAGDATGLNADIYGWVGSLSPLDIAVLQDKYGVNEEWATGNNIYTLKDVNAQGTYYSSIWDGGGVDEIRYSGARDATIDLRPATLQYEEGGGGRVSYAYGIYGGFTIANGVTIENATGGSGNDSLTGNEAANFLRGGLGNDSLTGLGGADRLNGEGGDDTILGGDGADRLDGGIGNDSLDGGIGADILQGGDGDDALTDTADGADQFYGGAGNDRMTVQRGAGALGNLVLDGGAGDDTFILQTHGTMTTARGGDGADRFELSGSATLNGGTGVDVIKLDAAFAGAVIVEDFQAGAGGDRFDLAGFLAARLTNWDGTANPFSTGHLRLNTSAAGTLIQIDADGGGNSWTTLVTLKGVTASALVQENLGYAVSTGSGPLPILGGPNADVLSGTAGPDNIQGLGGDDTLKGQAGDDQLYGGTGKDHLYGLAGADQLFGGDDADQLLGAEGDDILSGELGDDIIVGGLGKDTLTGGLGKDTFSYSLTTESLSGAADRITDFNQAEGDKLNLKAVDANTNLAGDQAFTFVASFSNQAGQAVRAYDSGANLTTLSFDVNGDGVADMVIELNGNVTGGWIL